MTKSRLPPVPDFTALDAAAPTTADERTRALALIGNLVFTWSNNESVFIYALMVLLETDFSSAAITFISLNTTRARLDLVRRLAKTKLTDDRLIDKVEKLIERFNECTRIRNEFNHCIYQLNERAQITHANVLRINEKKNKVEFAVIREFDDKRMRDIAGTIRKLTVLNRDLWTLLGEMEAHIRRRPGVKPGSIT
jgi:DNA integrity scanning protein DisA with diadenylate cyclase activity